MKKLSLIAIAVLLTVIAAAPAVSAQTNRDRIVAEIMRLEAEHIDASKKLKAGDFERIETDDFMMTARVPARIQTKAEIQARLKDPGFKRGTIESLTNDDVKVRVYNENTAITTGAWKRVSRDAAGKDTSAAGRFTHIWVRQNGRWQLAGAHYSPDIDLEKLKTGQTESRKN